MEEIQIINGREYKVEVGENEIFARQIANMSFNGYKIDHKSNGYTSTFYKIFGDEKKEIGRLVYDPNNYKFYLWKYINPKLHIMKKTNELGVNGVLYSKLRIGDYIYFEMPKKLYKIRVEKAAKVGNYKNFNMTGYNSELQFFIPLSELTEVATKTKKRARKRA